MRLQWILEGGLKRLGALFLLVAAVPLFTVGLGLMLWGLSTALAIAIDAGPPGVLLGSGHGFVKELSIGVSLVVLGVLIWLGSRRLDAAVRSLAARRTENALLRLAQERDGRLTVTEAAAETGFTAAETAAVLTRLSEQGFVEIEVTNAGVMVYRFPEIAYAPAPGESWTSRIESA